MDSAVFWMVWNPQRNRPIVRHPAERLARIEAERLAAKHPGEQFFVLEANTVSCIPPPVVTRPLEYEVVF